MTNAKGSVTEANVSTINACGPMVEDTILMIGAENPIIKGTTLVADVGGLVTEPLAPILVVCLKILLVILNTCNFFFFSENVLHIKYFMFENILIQNKRSINS